MFGTDLDTVPLSVIERVIGIITNAVLIAQFRSDLVQCILNFVAAVFRRSAGNKPSLSAAGVRECVENVHIDGVLIHDPGVASPARILLKRQRRQAWDEPSAVGIMTVMARRNNGERQSNARSITMTTLLVK